MGKKQVTLITSNNICRAVEEALAHAASGDLVPTFIIVPDRFTLQAEKILLATKSCLFNVRVVTFSMLFKILHEELVGDFESNVLDKTSAVLFMWRAIAQAKSKLVWYNRAAEQYAFAEKMFNTINQLSSSMVDFENDFPSKIVVPDKVRQKVNTSAEITRKKLHDICAIRSAYKELIADYTDSSGMLGWLLEKIGQSKLVKRSRIFVAGFQHLSVQRGAVVAELIKNAAAFTAAFQKGSELEQFLAELLINTECKHISADMKEVPRGDVRNFDTLQDEAIWVANEICRLVKTEGVRFRDIAVVAADYEFAVKVFQQTFIENGIAVNVDVGDDLLGHPLAQYIKEFLLLAATGGQMHFLGIIKNAYNRLNSEQEFETENNALKTGMRGNDATAVWVRRLQKCRTVKEYCSVLLELLPETDNIARRKLVELLETVSRISAQQKQTLQEFLNVFQALAAATKVSDIPALADAVLLVSATEYQPSFMPFLFVTGACDGAYPVAQDDTDIITAQDIANISVHIEPSPSLQNARNRRHARDILGSAGKKLYISYVGQTPSELIEKLPLADKTTKIACKTFATQMILKAIGDGTAFEDTAYYGGVCKSLDLGDMEYMNLTPSVTELQVAEKLFFPSSIAHVTQIDNFRKCPHYHYLVNGLRVYPRERNKIAANIVGTLLHKLAEEFTRKIIHVKRDRLDAWNAEGEMKKIVGEVFCMPEFRVLAADPKNAPVISNLKKESKFIAREIVRQVRESKYFPSFAEMPMRNEIEGVTIRGKADRVDVAADNHVVIIDYKTGLIDRQSLQLPLYMSLLPEKYTADAAYYFSLRPGKFVMHEVRQADARNKASEIISKIKKGVILPNPINQNACRYCVAANICQRGVNECNTSRGGEHDEN